MSQLEHRRRRFIADLKMLIAVKYHSHCLTSYSAKQDHDCSLRRVSKNHDTNNKLMKYLPSETQ